MGTFIEITNVNGSSLGTRWSENIISAIKNFIEKNYGEFPVIEICRDKFSCPEELNNCVLYTMSDVYNELSKCSGVWSTCSVKPYAYSVVRVYSDIYAKDISGYKFKIGMRPAHPTDAYWNIPESAVKITIPEFSIAGMSTFGKNSNENYNMAKRFVEAKFGELDFKPKHISIHFFENNKKLDSFSRIVYNLNGIVTEYKDCDLCAYFPWLLD